MAGLRKVGRGKVWPPRGEQTPCPESAARPRASRGADSALGWSCRRLSFDSGAPRRVRARSQLFEAREDPGHLAFSTPSCRPAPTGGPSRETKSDCSPTPAAARPLQSPRERFYSPLSPCHSPVTPRKLVFAQKLLENSPGRHVLARTAKPTELQFGGRVGSPELGCSWRRSRRGLVGGRHSLETFGSFGNLGDHVRKEAYPCRPRYAHPDPHQCPTHSSSSSASAASSSARRGGGLPESQSDCGTPERPMRAQAFPTSLEFSYPVEATFAVLTPYPPAPSSATLPPSLMVSAFRPQQLRTTNPLEAVKSDQPGWDLGFNSGSGYTCCASIQFVPDLAAGRNSALASVCSCRSWASF
ncbi:PREDICTED: DNA-directed RNA polymerase II subunit RPB1-like [Cercocebus atys]|uniref:DNA-directed RNA polymerase II subunit RPB1-like n=1 Tax=Cercocebus atys TaxID=9531 RepID=UPI0005F48882|nr:PREDICTED: DNA-directed RNA polymerase II subunit RPB1-like [Cercocebus atys]